MTERRGWILTAVVAVLVAIAGGTIGYALSKGHVR